MQARAFNSIAIDKKKESSQNLHSIKIKDEIHYYLNLPDKIVDELHSKTNTSSIILKEKI
ncbi:hypothetical protein [Legionella sp.]|uniref:hypothetical protein n=1 Tax=Legionella sp. TaxID=459 RepID=UPI003CB99C53